MQPPPPPAQPNESLINGIAVLQCVVGSPDPLGSREVSRRMGMTNTRANRLLGTLAHIGLLERNADRKYRPGPALHVLAAQSMMASRLLPAALPVLVRLRNEGFTVGLGVLWRDKICYLFHEQPGQSVEEAILRHALWPAQYTAAGLALLATQPDLPKFPPPDPSLRLSILPGQEPEVTLPLARRNGYALLKFKLEVTSLGVAVGQPPFAGLAVAGRHIGEAYYGEIAKKLHAAAEEIVRRMSVDTARAPYEVPEVPRES